MRYFPLSRHVIPAKLAIASASRNPGGRLVRFRGNDDWKSMIIAERHQIMSEKILIADDEPSNRKILAQELVHKGFVVDTACGGKEALAKLSPLRLIW